MAVTAGEVTARLHGGFAAHARGDYDAVAATFHNDAEVLPLGRIPIWGRKAIREWLEPQAFEEQRFELLEVHVEGLHAVTRQHTRARGAQSGIEFETEIWSAWTYDDDGLVLRLEIYPADARAEAFAAAGIEMPAG
jgi:ketosteroid isomerase-like protein